MSSKPVSTLPNICGVASRRRRAASPMFCDPDSHAATFTFEGKISRPGNIHGSIKCHFVSSSSSSSFFLYSHNSTLKTFSRSSFANKCSFAK
ncbi:hypothetical protein F2P81_010987 [Scophthalmus maximus]|uniref:Uncharacterized protein n=1 Tax=Scophthalmus maximus TaxID=52904 RepID=A0A6A4SSS1_SCOMX|nr:hypothetical protein F2P81_010987 [Scophthalmus maximus]